MSGAASNPESLGEANTDVGSQPHYRFTRQPVKYYRHHNPGTRLSNTGLSERPSAAPMRGCQGSADSSRSSSPELGAPRLSQTSDGHCETTCQAHQATVSAESKVSVPLSPREVVQYMLGLDSTFTSPAAATSSGTTEKTSQDEAAAYQADHNTTLTSRRQAGGQSHTVSRRTLPADHNLTSPAQKILSGLRLRRSHSGKDEQLFV